MELLPQNQDLTTFLLEIWNIKKLLPYSHASSMPVLLLHTTIKNGQNEKFKTQTKIMRKIQLAMTKFNWHHRITENLKLSSKIYFKGQWTA